MHHHNLVVVEVDSNFLDCTVDSHRVEVEVVDNMLEHLLDNIAVVEEVDHNLVDHRHHQQVLDHLVADNI